MSCKFQRLAGESVRSLASEIEDLLIDNTVFQNVFRTATGNEGLSNKPAESKTMVLALPGPCANDINNLILGRKQ